MSSPLAYGMIENKGELNHFGHPPVSSKYLKNKNHLRLITRGEGSRGGSNSADGETDFGQSGFLKTLFDAFFFFFVVTGMFVENQ